MNPVNVREALRSATAALHVQVDSGVPLAKVSPTLDDYRDHLRLLDDWVKALRQLAVDPMRLDAQAAALMEDLDVCDRLLGNAPRPAALPAEPSRLPATAEFDWGVAYVIEGSRLGGQVLYRRLKEALAPHPLAYLRGEGSATGARWTAFLAAMRAQVVSPEQVDRACTGAVQAFELLLRCQRSRSTSP